VKTKVCFKCEAELPIVNFYKHPRMADGHLNKCKACARYDVRQNRKVRVEYYREYDCVRSKTTERIEAIKKLARKDDVKRLARIALRNAVARGKVKRLPCEQCGKTPADAHHPDYAKPLDVVWLCRQHHMDLHRL